MPNSQGARTVSAFTVAEKFGYNTGKTDKSSINWERALTNIAFTTHGIPDMPEVPQVIALLTVPMELASESHLGYHVADFLAFASLMHNSPAKNSQVWLSCLDIPAAMAKYGATYGHSKQPDTGLATKVTDVLGKGIITHIISPEEMRNRFLDEVTKKSSSNGAPLLILVFGETSLEQSVFFRGPAGPTVTKNDIREKLELGTRATIVTSSPFTGGWLVNPFLGHNPKLDDELAPYLAAIHCGGAFTQKHLDLLQDHINSPLVPQELKPFIVGFPSALTEHGCFTEQSKVAHQFFYEMVRRLMATRSTKAAAHHALNFSEENDETLEPRTGPTLGWWKAKWDALPTTTPSAQDSGFAILGTSFGGTKASQTRHVQCLVRLEMATCKGDWELLTTSATKKLFQDFLSNGCPEESDVMHVLDVLEYRSSAMMVADIAIDALGLRRPQGQTCRDWDFAKFGEDEKVDKRLGEGRKGAFGELPEQTFTNVAQALGHTYDRSRSPTFHRPALYISAAIAEHAVRNIQHDNLQYYHEWAKGFVQKFVNHGTSPLIPLHTDLITLLTWSLFLVVGTIVSKQYEALLRNEALMVMGKVWIDSLDLSNDRNRPLQHQAGLESSRHAPKNRAPITPPHKTGVPSPTGATNSSPDAVGPWKGTPTMVAGKKGIPSTPNAPSSPGLKVRTAAAAESQSPQRYATTEMISRSGVRILQTTPVRSRKSQKTTETPSPMAVTKNRSVALANGDVRTPSAVATETVLAGLLHEFPQFSAFREDFLRNAVECILRLGRAPINSATTPAVETIAGKGSQTPTGSKKGETAAGNRDHPAATAQQGHRTVGYPSIGANPHSQRRQKYATPVGAVSATRASPTPTLGRKFAGRTVTEEFFVIRPRQNTPVPKMGTVLQSPLRKEISGPARGGDAIPTPAEEEGF